MALTVLLDNAIINTKPTLDHVVKTISPILLMSMNNNDNKFTIILAYLYKNNTNTQGGGRNSHTLNFFLISTVYVSVLNKKYMFNHQNISPLIDLCTGFDKKDTNKKVSMRVG